MKKAFQSVQNRGLKPTDTRPSESSLPPLLSAAALGQVGAFLRKVVPAMWKKGSETAQPEVVPVGTRDDSKSWTTIDGVITGLTHFERVALNAMEERVLPPDVRIKIVVAQANAGEDEEEMEEDVKRLDGLVRTLALYGVLERSTVQGSKLEDISLKRSKDLGRMLVAAVQLELFQLLDDICEAGDVDNELFDDLCCDTIQEGARDGFVHLTPDLLLAPGSGYKRLLQIRKDQLVEIIADVGGIRAIGAHDVHSPGSDQSFQGRRSLGALDSACGSPPGGNAPSEAGFNGESGGEGRSTPQPLKPRSLSPVQHHRSQTERVRELLSSIDGLVTTMERASSTQASLSGLMDLPPLSPEGLQYRRSGSLGPPDGVNGQNGAGAEVGGSDEGGTSGPPLWSEDKDESLASPLVLTQTASEERDTLQPRAFFPEESDPLQPCADPIALAEGRSPIPPLAGSSSSRTLLLSEVDWLIAGTKAALGEDPEEFLSTEGFGRDVTDTETTLASTRDGLDTARDSLDVGKEGTREEMSERSATLESTAGEGLGVTSGKERGEPGVLSSSVSGDADGDGLGNGVGEHPSLAFTGPRKESSQAKVVDCSAPGADDDDADDGGEDASWELAASRAMVARAGTGTVVPATRFDRGGISLTKSLCDRVSAVRMPVGQVKASDQKISDGSTEVGHASIALSGMDADTDGDEDFAPDVREIRAAGKAVSPRREGQWFAAGSSLPTLRSLREKQRATSSRRLLGATGFKEVRLGPALSSPDDGTREEHGSGSGTFPCQIDAARGQERDDEKSSVVLTADTAVRSSAQSVRGNGLREMSGFPSVNDENVDCCLGASGDKESITALAGGDRRRGLDRAAPTEKEMMPSGVNSEKFVREARGGGEGKVDMVGEQVWDSKDRPGSSVISPARDVLGDAIDVSSISFVWRDTEVALSTAPEGHVVESDHQALSTSSSTTVASGRSKTSSRSMPVHVESVGVLSGDRVSQGQAGNGGSHVDANEAKTSG